MNTDFFSGIPLFADLTPAEREDLARLLQPRRFDAHHAVFWIGEPGDEFFIIESGQVVICYPDEHGEEKTLAVLGPGHFFGELSLLDGGRRTATARAQTESRLLSLGREAFHDFLKKHPVSAIHILSTIGRRQRDSLDKLRAAIDARFSPQEPSRAAGNVPRRKRRDFHGALWATRRRLWVDRAASAWLIRRFIDPQARFEWLAKPADCPDEAHGFDFDGAEFTHVEDRVTFEVLLTAFSLDGDPGLDGLARLVHYLDVGGGKPVLEAAGFEAVLTGLRDSCADDDALLVAVTPVLDALYQHFSHSKAE